MPASDYIDKFTLTAFSCDHEKRLWAFRLAVTMKFGDQTLDFAHVTLEVKDSGKRGRCLVTELRPDPHAVAMADICKKAQAMRLHGWNDWTENTTVVDFVRSLVIADIPVFESPGD